VMISISREEDYAGNSVRGDHIYPAIPAS
jgi:hypothetical protein